MYIANIQRNQVASFPRKSDSSEKDTGDDLHFYLKFHTPQTPSKHSTNRALG